MMKFRLSTILWVFALFASAMALFRWYGVFVASIIAILYAVYAIRNVNGKTGPTLVEVFILSAICGFILSMSAMHTGYFNSLHKREWCQRQMRDLAFAIKHFRKRTGDLPRNIPTLSGKALTWRVRLLPDLGYQKLIEQYSLDSKWDGIITPKLCMEEPFEVTCPVWARDSTAKRASYFAVVGEETYWMDDSSPYRNIQSDYSCDTVMLIEANPDRGEWVEAHDLTMDEAITLLTTVPDWKKPDGHFVNEMYPWRSFFYKPTITRNIVMTDGTVRTIYSPLPRNVARAILTDRQEMIVRSELGKYCKAQLDYGKLWGFVVFCFIVVLPALSRKRAQKTSRRQ